jgi:hypothetical protein
MNIYTYFNLSAKRGKLLEKRPAFTRRRSSFLHWAGLNRAVFHRPVKD